MNKKNSKIRLALAQINPIVGDLEGNKEKILQRINEAKSYGCDLVALPELCIPGYPPEDLLLRKQFIIDQRTILNEIADQIRDIVCIVGYVDAANGVLYNSAAILQEGRLAASYHKIHLPNYSVFDEERYFKAGDKPLVVHYQDAKIGISICEDIWIADSVTETEAFVGGAEILLNISASPFYIGKGQEREALMTARARRTRAFVVYINLIGGQDELVFDGRSLVIAPDGRLLAQGNTFDEDFIVIEVDPAEAKQIRQKDDTFAKNARAFSSPFATVDEARLTSLRIHHKPVLPERRAIPPAVPDEEEVYRAITLGLRDYIHKNNFSKVTLGLSGGIDSALVAVLAVDALGKENVVAVSMPSQFSSQGSKDDARQLAENLGIEFLMIPIQDVFVKYQQLLQPIFKDLPFDITEENLQARIRGNLLMALSNKFGWIVLATGNKSEVSVGYSTLYGDTAGGFSPLKDVFKTMVYRLCHYRNQKAGYDLIPQSILTKAPSAELRPDQTDQDTLPPYDLLDHILEMYVEKEMGVAEIMAKGYDADIVRQVARMVDANEYKRRQAAPGVKITPRAFGKDRRMPITNRYRAR